MCAGPLRLHAVPLPPHSFAQGANALCCPEYILERKHMQNFDVWTTNKIE